MNRLLALVLTWTVFIVPHAHAVKFYTRAQRLLGCAQMIDGHGKVEFVRADQDMILIRAPGGQRDISTVTYDLQYTLDSFGLSQAELKTLVAGKKVVLVGEGFGAFLPAVIASNGRATSIDPLYAINSIADLDTTQVTSIQMRALQSIEDFLRRYRPLLRAGSAQNIPLDSESQDLYFTHFVFNNFVDGFKNFDWDYVEAGFREALRVVKPDGFIFNALSVDAEDPPQLEAMLRRMKSEGRFKLFKISYIPARHAVGRSENGFTSMSGRHVTARIFIFR